VRLEAVEQAIVQEAEEARTRALSYLEHGEDLVILAQLVRSAADSYDEAAALLVQRARAERAAVKAVAR
jgi:hypothetical protein